ncbi:hypothetical protein B5F33_06395 [Collinsella sp. An2]|nr:hypothetical protein B5F33_06395 [Collinsella sp. An2]
MDPVILSLFGILVAFIVLVIGAMKGFPILVVAPVAGAIVIATSGLPLFETLDGAFAQGLGSFIISNFMLFLPACIMGALLADCGAARDIAVYFGNLAERFGGKHVKFLVIMGLSIVTALLSLGGVSGAVVVFTIAPICRQIFKRLDIPWHFVIPIIVYGGCMWTATLPGSPCIENLIPIEYLGTTPMAAPVLGFIATGNCIIFGACYIWYAVRKCERRGEGYMLTGAEMERHVDTLDEDVLTASCSNLQLLKALTPSIVLLFAMNVLSFEPYVALILGCVVCLVLYHNKFENFSSTLQSGCKSTIGSLMNVAVVVGFGAVVELTPGFKFLVDNLANLPGPPLFQLWFSCNLVAGITGSAAGGEGIALGALGDRFLAMGVSPEVIHRIVNVSCYGLDTMPFNGNAINRLNYCHLTYRNAYYHEFILGAIFPVINSFIITLIASMGLM